MSSRDGWTFARRAFIRRGSTPTNGNNRSNYIWRGLVRPPFCRAAQGIVLPNEGYYRSPGGEPGVTPAN
jgi:hypothetical protein